MPFWFRPQPWGTTATTSTWWPLQTMNATQATTAASASMYYDQAYDMAWVQPRSRTATISGTATTNGMITTIWHDTPIPHEVQRMADEVLDAQAAQARAANVAAPAILRRPRVDPELERYFARDGVSAHKRARELLLSLLTDDQRQSYEKRGWFIVVGGSSGRRYRIRGGSYAGNVDLLAANDNDKVEAVFCGHCDGSIPLGDHLLAQKVMLEIDEPAFIKLANRRAA